MPDDIPGIPWWLRLPFIPAPRDTPSLPAQLKCPPGQHRGRPGEGCVPDADDTGTLRELPDEGFVAPAPPPRSVPPKVPGPAPTPTGPSPADVLPRAPAPSYPSTLPLPRQRPTRLPSLPTLLPRLVTTGFYFGVLWELLFRPYFEGPLRTRPTGPPRRTRPPVDTSPVYYPAGWPDAPTEIFGAPGPLRRVRPLPRTTVRSYPVDLPEWAVPVPGGPQPLPRTVPTVRTVPAPRWTLDDPLPGPGYDPYTYQPPAPAPQRPAQPFPRTAPRDFPWPFGLPRAVPGSRPRSTPGPVARPLTPQQPARAPRTPRPVKRPGPLTPLQPDVPPLPQFQPRPTQANPCTEQRTARRRRQSECRKFTTKTIRVCADRS